MIAPFFPPRRRVGALRPYKFALNLRAHGWQPVVANLASSGELTAREARLLDGIGRVDLRSLFDRTEDELGKTNGQGKRDEAPHAVERALKTLLDEINRCFPVDSWLPLLLGQRPALDAWIRRHRPDAIWSTADPWSSHVLARSLARRHRLPWVADYRDPWTLCPVRAPARPPIMHRLDVSVESRVLRDASAVTFTAQSTTEAYRSAFVAYAEKMHTIENAFEPACFEESPDAIEPSADRLEVVFFGRFRDLSPAAPIARWLSRAKDIDPALARHIVIRSSGPLDAASREIAARLGVTDRFVEEAGVPYEATLTRLRSADLLLLSTHPDRSDIIPAKLWDYLAADRPIVSLSTNPNIAEVLERTGTGVQFAPDAVARGAGLLLSCAQAKSRGEPLAVDFGPRPDALERYTAAHKTAALARLLDRVTDSAASAASATA